MIVLERGSSQNQVMVSIMNPLRLKHAKPTPGDLFVLNHLNTPVKWYPNIVVILVIGVNMENVYIVTIRDSGKIVGSCHSHKKWNLLRGSLTRV